MRRFALLLSPPFNRLENGSSEGSPIPGSSITQSAFFQIRTLCPVSLPQEEMNGWLEAVAASVGEHAEIARWGQTLPTTSSTDEGNPKREAGERRASGRRK